MSNWIEDYIPLQRPEYTKQSEALLTDLIWHSNGSSLSRDDTASPGSTGYLRKLANLKRKDKSLPAMHRLIPRHVTGNTHVIQTFPVAQNANIDQVVAAPTGASSLTKAFLESILAPKSRGDRSIACVPIHPQAVVFQSLQGLVNKNAPPNMADAIEVMGQLGGATYNGEVATKFLELLTTSTKPSEGLTGLLDALFPVIAKYTWESLPTLPTVESISPQNPSLPAWPSSIQPLQPSSSQSFPLMPAHKLTPFNWFWENWKTLYDPATGWFDKLPSRRFIDWSLCLLRTGLAFSYLWEADFFCKLQACIIEKVKTPGLSRELDSLLAMFREGPSLAIFEKPSVPIRQKDTWKSLSSQLARGYEVRKILKNWLDQHLQPSTAPQSFSRFDAFVEYWLNTTPTSLLENLVHELQSIDLKPDTAINTKYFVRYLLQPRSSSDDLVDQADFYYLARTNSKESSFWFQPGPEWLVVVTSLQCKKPGGKCTLRNVLDDISRLGIQVERSVLVSMLEEAGLSMDSPDADNALVINSAF
jgi:hypothetical protein